MKGSDQCPRCASRRWIDARQPVTGFYAEIIRVCGNCGTAWEPFDKADLLDTHDRLSSFNHPCNNCAFRKGSPELADKDDWESKMISMSFGAGFYCHKGVPIDPKNENGFAYPEDGKNRRKLRLCRGYLNSIVGPRLNELAACASELTTASDGEQPWIDPL